MAIKINSGTTGTTNTVNVPLCYEVPASASDQNFILPKKQLLPEDSYESVIIDVTTVNLADGSVGIDCKHKLVNTDGRTFFVKFRMFPPTDINELVDTLYAYGMTGTLNDILPGLTEIVEVTPRRRNSDYMRISYRQLLDKSTAIDSPEALNESILHKKNGNTFPSKYKKLTSILSSPNVSLIDTVDEDNSEVLTEEDN